ncbi:unnamed protein product [Ilex paraguariensis]|uniref:Uncharacterized protein n=1 Tax=Ilex paraguariensis TaxID=185542 RepID=A0ABC8S9C0_9AQUA
MNSQTADNDSDPITTLKLQPEDDDPDCQPQEDEEKPLPQQEVESQQHYYITSIHSTVIIRQLPSQGLSFQLWPAAATLVTLLDRHRCDPSNGTTPLSPTLSAFSSTSGESCRQIRILELGSGTGLVGIAAAAILNASVMVTDLPHVLPNLRYNAGANADVVAVNGGSIDVAPLRWGENDDMEAVGRDYDLILGTDVVYYNHLYDPLLETLRFLLIGSGKKTVFLMAHLKRWKKESAFFKKAKKLFDVEIIHRDDPYNGSRVGVVVYRFVGKVVRK